MKRLFVIISIVILLFSYPVTAQSQTGESAEEKAISTIEVVSNEEATEEDRQNIIQTVNGVKIQEIRQRQDKPGIEVDVISPSVSTLHFAAISGDRGKASTVIVDNGKSTVVIPYAGSQYWITVQGEMRVIKGDTDLFNTLKAYYIPVSGLAGAVTLLVAAIRWYRKQEEKGVNEFIPLE